MPINYLLLISSSALIIMILISIIPELPLKVPYPW
jgi:hypothetical protein